MSYGRILLIAALVFGGLYYYHSNELDRQRQEHINQLERERKPARPPNMSAKQNETASS
jgi:hypothetical protein